MFYKLKLIAEYVNILVKQNFSFKFKFLQYNRKKNLIRVRASVPTNHLLLAPPILYIWLCNITSHLRHFLSVIKCKFAIQYKPLCTCGYQEH